MQKKVRQEVSHLGQKCSILSTNESIKKPLKSIKKKKNFSIVNFVFKKFIIDFLPYNQFSSECRIFDLKGILIRDIFHPIFYHLVHTL